ncbi:MAG: ferredoxin reductase family protein [Candidatus Pacearchaeota archaeon]|jgi:predicted ferric reductase
MNKRVGYSIILILGLIPILIWIGMEPLSSRFSNLTSIFTNLGRIFALSGICFFALTFLLNTRLKFLENLFGGLDKLYKAHHVFGTTAFILILFHPIFLSIQYLVFSTNSAAMFFVPTISRMPVNFGIVSLAIMVVLLFFTFFVNLKYNTWKISHKFLVIAFILAVIHVLLISSDVSRNTFLKNYVFTIILIGIISLLYKTIFYKILKKRKKFIVEKVNKLNHNVLEIILKPEKDIKNYKSGQFIFVSFKQKGLKEYHPFTISSSPSEDNLKLTIKESGDWTKKLNSLNVGTKAFVEGPYGKFYANENSEQIWIAGGIGITPFLSMARHSKIKSKIDLFYSVKDAKDAVFIEELNKLSKGNFKVHIIYTSKGKRLTVEDIFKRVEIKNKEILICGPVEMMINLKEQLLNKGVHNKKIHMEEFNL